jgi:hypothetical protein
MASNFKVSIIFLGTPRLLGKSIQHGCRTQPEEDNYMISVSMEDYYSFPSINTDRKWSLKNCLLFI